MIYKMDLIANTDHLKKVLSNLRQATNALKDIPFDAVVSYKPYITMSNELECLSAFKKGSDRSVSGVLMKSIETTSDLTDLGRFIHSPKSGDFLTISKKIRDYLLSDIGLWCVDISSCEARIAGELAGDSKLIEDYECGDLYYHPNVMREDYKKAFLTYLNGGKDEYKIGDRYPTLQSWRLSEMRSNARWITLLDGEKIERSHNYKDISKLIQGNGAAILRIALKTLQKNGIDNLPHLHDCIYCTSEQVEAVQKALSGVVRFKVSSEEMKSLKVKNSETIAV